MTDTSKLADTKQSLSLKLFIHKENRKVVFAEVKKDFIDFLFNLMTLPLGTVTQILKKNEMVGSIGTIHESIDNINENYFLSKNQTKEILLKPSTPDATTQLITPLEVPAQRPKTFYLCGKDKVQHFPVCVAEDPRATCVAPNHYNCYSRMSRKVSSVSYQPNSTERGYVKDEVAYMVADDLTVEPITATSIVNLLSLKGIKRMGTLEQNVVYLDMEKAMKLLKASLQSKAVLTSVFLSDNLQGDSISFKIL